MICSSDIIFMIWFIKGILNEFICDKLWIGVLFKKKVWINLIFVVCKL